MSYVKQTWTTGDVISAEKMNHIEDGIEANDIDIMNRILDPDGHPLDVEGEENTNSRITSAVESGSIDLNTGALAEDPDSVRTVDFIAVAEGSTVIMTNTAALTSRFICYDSNKNVLIGWNDGLSYAWRDNGGSLEIPSGCAYIKLNCTSTDTSIIFTIASEGVVVTPSNRAEHKTIYIANHGYKMYGDIIDDATMHKMVIEAEGLDDNSYNIFEVKAPITNPEEATIALMNWGEKTRQFVDFSSMRYGHTGQGSVEIVCQARGTVTPLPEFSCRFNNGNGAGRIKKFAVNPDAKPFLLTSRGIKTCRSNSYSNDWSEDDTVIVDIVDMYDKVNLIYNALVANGMINAINNTITSARTFPVEYGGISKTTGEEYEGDGIRTDFINVANVAKIKIASATGLNWCLIGYDSSKKISTITDVTNNSSVPLSSLGFTYIRFCCWDTIDLATTITITPS